MAQWLESGALSISLPAVWFRIPLGAGFYHERRNITVPSSQYWDIVSMFVSLGKALNRHMLNLTKVKMSTWKDKDGNVYDKFNAPKLLHDCMLAVELKWHTHEQVQ